MPEDAIVPSEPPDRTNIRIYIVTPIPSLFQSPPGGKKYRTFCHIYTAMETVRRLLISSGVPFPYNLAILSN
jgi:hypothetical protein